jgi:hypothetical protein
MRLSRDTGLVLSGLWLVLAGLFALLAIRVAGSGLVLDLLSVIAGALLLLSTSGAFNRNPGFLLLAIWLIVHGLVGLLPIRIAGLGTVLDLVALGAGILLLVGARGRSVSHYPGTLLLSIWLIATGVLGLAGLSIAGLVTLLALVAIVAGILILLGA